MIASLCFQQSNTPVFMFAAVDCGNLPSPSNGRITLTASTFGGEAIYHCDAGYNLIGNMSRMCAANGEWTGSAPTCQSE